MSTCGEIILSPDEILLIVQRHLLENNEDNLDVIGYELKPFSNTIQGFLSNNRHLKIVVKHNIRGRVVGHQLEFFAKITPIHSAAQTKYLEDLKVFEKESNIYRLLIPRLEIINIAKIFAPKCYLTRNDILVFENLSDSRYRLGTTDGALLDYDHLKVALKTLACMHSASIVLETRTSKTMAQLYPKCVAENSYPDDPNTTRYTSYQLGVETLATFIPLIPKYADFPNIGLLTEKFTAIMQKIFNFVKSSNVYRNVFCHGDLWANNLLFRYQDASGKGSVPYDCKLIDYQLSRYAPPALDILSILCIQTTRNFRQNNLANLLDDYYKYLERYLIDHNISIEDEVPRNEFDESVEFFKLAALIESCFFGHITLLPENIANSICNNCEDFQMFLSDDRINICTKVFGSDSVYRDRITDSISEIIDKYILCTA